MKTKARRAALLPILLAGVLAPATLLAQAPPPRWMAALHEGVVVDASTGTAFVMSPEGGLDALDLATGTVKWKS